MKPFRTAVQVAAPLLSTVLAGQAALAQSFSITLHSINSGGTTEPGPAIVFQLRMSIGQFEAAAGPQSGGTFSLNGGFWPEAGGAAPCYANCDLSTAIPVLTANDFQCFLNSFAAAAAYANCDGSTVNPILTANDFQCFLNRYAAGCT